ncbi:MAG: response regulator [Polyangiales bacterium]|nr:response regulator [Sandaracinaceae bacterium]
MRASPPPEAADDQLTVLVIEDDPDMQRLLVDLVIASGHQVVAAESAEEGLALLTQWSFQMAILDHNLPGMEGILLGEYLRRHNPHITIALVTGDDDPRLPRESRQHEIEFVAKPFEPERIERLLRDAVIAGKERMAAEAARGQETFEPPIAAYVDQVGPCYDIPKVPDRLAKRLVDTLKRHLNNLRNASRYNERDRVVAFSGLLSAKVLGLDLPRAASGKTLYEEYDALMRQHGRRPEFDERAA